jgi:hypothetical protein
MWPISDLSEFGELYAALRAAISAGAFFSTISHPHFHTRVSGWIIKDIKF